MSESGEASGGEMPVNRRFLSAEEFDALSPEGQREFVVESQVPPSELTRAQQSWLQGATERARVRVLRRIRVKEGPEVFRHALDAIAQAEGGEVRDRLLAAVEQDHRQAS